MALMPWLVCSNHDGDDDVQEPLARMNVCHDGIKQMTSGPAYDQPPF
jgi:hypothetical protein